jgi:adenylate kinase
MFNILIFGPPGSGKGTCCSLISKKYGFFHFVMSYFLNLEIDNRTEIGDRIRSIIENGNLISNELLMEIFSTNFTKITSNNSKFVFDGIPRTIEQAKFLDNFLIINFNSKIDLVIVIDVEKNTLLERISSRMICSSCKYSFTSKEYECDNCKVELIKRSDDNKDIFEKRIEIYNNTFREIIDYYENSGRKVTHIDGNPDVSTVSGDIFNEIEKILQEKSE